VVEAEDGLDALERLADTPDVACVVTDVVMPQLSGQRLAQEIWATSPDVPVLFTSGYSDDLKLDAETSTGPSAFVQKPCPPNELRRLVRALIEDAP
jgi:CheY-like chemotaxis protein